MLGTAGVLRDDALLVRAAIAACIGNQGIDGMARQQQRRLSDAVGIVISVKTMPWRWNTSSELT
jgi:hypothetical protein